MFSGFGTALTAYRAAVQTLDEAKITAATNELTVQLAHLGAKVLTMQQERLQATERERALLREKNDLEDQIASLEQKDRGRARYELVDVNMGAFAYRPKSSCANGEPTHYVCQGCLDNKAMKVVIQRDTTPGRDAICPECETTFWFNWFRG